MYPLRSFLAVLVDLVNARQPEWHLDIMLLHEAKVVERKPNGF
jgi:hypothetical protein